MNNESLPGLMITALIQLPLNRVPLTGICISMVLLVLTGFFYADSQETRAVSHTPQHFTGDAGDRLQIDSCIGCHGSNNFIDARNPADLWKSSYQIWRIRDPHTRAYASLWNARSRKIVAALSNKSVVEQQDHESIINERCVSCHSTVAGNQSLTSDGVSCHSCHSQPLSDHQLNWPWIEQHSTQAWADGKVNKTESGLFDLADLNLRAQACIRCHVGSEHADVNHDLIAAGHPRLMFEYSSHLSRLPVHWQEHHQSETFHAECWSIGQFELAKSSLQLLRKRVRLAEQGERPWPEFSEYNCHHCHHDLTAEWYVPSSGMAAAPAWGTWALAAGNLEFPTTEALRQEMQRVLPDKKTVDELASQLIQAVGNQSHKQQLYKYIRKRPQLNSDELYAWYLAAASALRDIINDRGKLEPGPQEKVVKLNGLMIRLKSYLETPFKTRQDRPTISPQQIHEMIDEIRDHLLIPGTPNEPRFQNR